MFQLRIIKSSAVFLVLISILFSCNDSRPPEEEIIAEAFGDFFLVEDLHERMPVNYKKEDSAKISEEIIKDWINQKVILSFAEKNIDTEKESIQKKLQNYRNSLVIYEYERALINQKLDTSISDLALEEYYNENSENFKLNTEIVKVWFIQVSKDAPQKNQLESWFLSDDLEDFDKLFEYCQKYAENYYFEDDNWLYIDELLKEVPAIEDDWQATLKNSTYKKFETEYYDYLVRFFDHKLRGEISPVSLEKDRIKDLIVNKRKVDLLRQMKDDIVREAFGNGNVKIYEK